MAIAVPEYVLALDPYKPGNQRKKVDLRHGVTSVFSLASNENPHGTPPSVIEAIKGSLETLNLYPDPEAGELTSLIAEKFGKKQSQVVCGHGSESLIAHIVNAFSDLGTRVLTSRGTFAGIYVKTNKIGRKLNRVPLLDYGYDLEGIVSRIRPDTRIIYISNPNNPTGSMVTRDEFEWFLSKVPDNILILLDEAYSIYGAQHRGYVDGMKYDLPNLIVLQTLSKTHGLAGLRIGYAVGPEELIATLYKVKLPFEPSLIAQKAAVAALKDDEYVQRTVLVNQIALRMMMRTFDELGIKYVYPYANFVMILLSNQEFVQEFCTHSLQHGVAVRNCKPFGIPNGVRISTGTHEQTEYACQIFEHVYNELKEKFPDKIRLDEEPYKED